MADNYTVQSQRRTVQVLSQTQTLDVEEVGAVTKPSGVSFLREIPFTAWQAGGAGEFIEPVAAAIEGRMSSDFVQDAYFVQEPGANLLLANRVAFVVQLPGQEAMTTVVEIPVELLGGTDTFVQQIVAEKFQTALNALQATAAL